MGFASAGAQFEAEEPVALIIVANAVAAFGVWTDRLDGSTAAKRLMGSPVSVNDPLNVGGAAPPTTSVPTRTQFGSRLSLRIQAWRSGLKGVSVFRFGYDS